jgi:putative transposase
MFCQKVVRFVAARKTATGHLMEIHGISERCDCRVLKLRRSVMRYQCHRQDDVVLRERLKTLAEHYPQYDYLLVHALLRRESLVQNCKRAYRLYTELGLQVRIKRRRKHIKPRTPVSVARAAKERWSLDFVSRV